MGANTYRKPPCSDLCHEKSCVLHQRSLLAATFLSSSHAPPLIPIRMAGVSPSSFDLYAPCLVILSTKSNPKPSVNGQTSFVLFYRTMPMLKVPNSHLTLKALDHCTCSFMSWRLDTPVLVWVTLQWAGSVMYPALFSSSVNTLKPFDVTHCQHQSSDDGGQQRAISLGDIKPPEDRVKRAAQWRLPRAHYPLSAPSVWMWSDATQLKEE